MSSRPRPECPKCKLPTVMIRYLSEGAVGPVTAVHMFCLAKNCDFDGTTQLTPEQVHVMSLGQTFLLSSEQKAELMAK